MPPKPKKTREQVVDAAVEIIRQKGLSALTARSLGSSLGVAPSSIFTHFDSMEAVSEAAVEAARGIYEQYVQRGLAMNPPFKGFGMELLRFAEEEPNLFSLLFFTPSTAEPEEWEGHKELILTTIANTFDIGAEPAQQIYRSLWIYVCGMATLQATGVLHFTEEERSRHLGNACRGFLLAALAPEDERSTVTPRKGLMIDGSLESYLVNKEEK